MKIENDLFINLKEKVNPGIQLAKSDLFKSGENTYEENGYIYSLNRGIVNIINDNEIIIQLNNNNYQYLTKKNDVVHCKVIKLMVDAVIVKILTVNNIPLTQNYQGKIIRRELRLKEVDKVRVDECMEINDILLAKVISNSDSKYIQLTIAEKELGVLFSYGKYKNLLKYKNDEEMFDEKTNEIFKKKLSLLHEIKN